MRTLWVILLLVLVTALGAQTRRIAHRAHGGADKERYDDLNGNYGNTPMFQTRVVAKQKIVRLDSGKDSVVWDLDTVYDPVPYQYLPTSGLLLQHPVVTNIGQMGKVCKKLTK